MRSSRGKPVCRRVARCSKAHVVSSIVEEGLRGTHMYVHEIRAQQTIPYVRLQVDRGDITALRTVARGPLFVVVRVDRVDARQLGRVVERGLGGDGGPLFSRSEALGWAAVQEE